MEAEMWVTSIAMAAHWPEPTAEPRAVEAEPADPEEGAAHEDEEHVVGGHGLALAVGLALADNERGREARHARADLHDVAT